MPLFSYFCKARHETERISSLASRPEVVECAECKKPSHLGFAVSKHQGVLPTATLKKSYDEEPSGLALHSFECKTCDETFDHIIDYSTGERASKGIDCPTCGAPSKWIPSARIDRSSERFPYFDRGLGLWVKSKQHRAEICNNPRQYGIDSDKLTPVDGDWDEERYIGDKQRKEDELVAGYNEYVDQLEHAPAFKSYRVARDKGLV